MGPRHAHPVALDHLASEFTSARRQRIPRSSCAV
jgi:hypothetical protein